MIKTPSQSIKLTREDDLWVALDEETNIASQGITRQQALNNLDEALEVTKQAKETESEATEPDVPWFK